MFFIIPGPSSAFDCNQKASEEVLQDYLPVITDELTKEIIKEKPSLKEHFEIKCHQASFDQIYSKATSTNMTWAKGYLYDHFTGRVSCELYDLQSKYRESLNYEIYVDDQSCEVVEKSGPFY